MMKFGRCNVADILTVVVLGGSVLSTKAFVNPHKTLPKRHGLLMSEVAMPESPSLTNLGQVGTLSKPSQDNRGNRKKEDEQNDVPTLGTIMKMLPKESFHIDTKESLFYFGVDFIACVASLGFLNAVVTSDLYHSFPLWGQALSVAPLQVLSGFALWCMVRFSIIFWMNWSL